MEIMTLQEELASEQRTLAMLVKIVNEQSAHFEALQDEAAATEAYSARLALLQRALVAKQYRDSLQRTLNKQEQRVRALRLQIEEDRLLRIANLEMHGRLQQIAPAPITPEAA